MRHESVLRCGMIVLVLLSAGCDNTPGAGLVDRINRLVSTTVSGTLTSDLEQGKIALREREWDRAEKLLERFLRATVNPDERWEAWLSLLDATDKAGQDRRWINDYLEAMLAEFESNPERVRIILTRMGEVQEASRLYERAVSTWLQLVGLPGVSAEESARIYHRLALLQIRLNRIQGAEDTLHECLSLPLADAKKAPCMYALADLSVMRDDLGDAANIVTQLIDAPDVSQDIRSRAVFLLADIYEQQRKFPEAQALFESIRETYPNQLAVDARLNYLKKKSKR